MRANTGQWKCERELLRYRQTNPALEGEQSRVEQNVDRANSSTAENVDRLSFICWASEESLPERLGLGLGQGLDGGRPKPGD